MRDIIKHGNLCSLSANKTRFDVRTKFVRENTAEKSSDFLFLLRIKTIENIPKNFHSLD